MDTNQRRQENNLSQTNTFTKGMNTDVAYDFVSNDQYLFGKNIRIINNAILCEEPDSNNVNGVVAPVPAGKGVSFVFKDVKDLRTNPATEKTETQKLWEGYDDKIVDRILAVKTVDNIGAIILKYKGTNEEPTKGLWRVFKAEKIQEKNDQDVLVDKIALTYIYVSTEKTDRNRFSIAINKETTDLTKLYIADGVHSMIIINLTEKDLSYYEGLTEDELSPNRIFPDKSPVFVDKIAGTLQTSQVQYAYRLYKKYGVCSKMSPLTHKIQVISNSRQTDVGNEEDTQSSIGFRLRIDIAHRHAQLYDKIQLYRISYIKYGEEPKCELIWDAKFDKSGMGDNDDPIQFNISDSGLKPLEEYTVDEFNQLSGLNVVPQLIDYNQQYMFAADITDESVIKIKDTELNMQAYSANRNKKIRLYNNQTYGSTIDVDYKDFDSIGEAAVNSNTFYLNKYVDMSLLDYYSLDSDNKCMFVPGTNTYDDEDADYWTGYGILGGKGPNIEWRFIVRKSPIHEDIYLEHFANNEKYKNQLDSQTSTYQNDQLAALQWGYAEEINSYDEYALDVPNVSSTEDIQYKILIDNGSRIIDRTIQADTDYLENTKDSKYLKQHQIELRTRSNSYDNVFTSSMFRSLERGESYRYGIVFYDNSGNRTDVNWIADIRVPTSIEYPITECTYDDVKQKYIMFANVLGLQFKINIPVDVITKYNLRKYEIVRCKKSPEFSKILIQVATSRPLSQKQFLLDKGKEDTYYPYYASALLTTDPYQIGFKMNKGQGRDFASASEVNNYHRGTKNDEHQLDFLQLFAPEILYRREDTLDILTNMNIQLHTLRFAHSNLTLNDYDVIFRCKHQYDLRWLDSDMKFDDSAWNVVSSFEPGAKGVHNRCIEYGQCLFGYPGENPFQLNEDNPYVQSINIKPNEENWNDGSFPHMHPHLQVSCGLAQTGQPWFNIPKEWQDNTIYYNLINNYINTNNCDANLKDTTVLKAYEVLDSDKRENLPVHSGSYVSKWLSSIYPNSGKIEYQYGYNQYDKTTFMAAPYLVIGGIRNSDTEDRLRMYTPFPVINRAYIENDKDSKQRKCYVFKNYYFSNNQNYPANKYSQEEHQYDKYKVLENQLIDITSIADVQNPLWEDGYDDVELSSSIVDTAVKKYKTYLTSVGNKTYCNWSACGLYNWRAGQNDTVARITPSEDPDDSGGNFNRIQHFFSPGAEDAKGYHPGSTYWGDGTGKGNGATCDYWTCPSKDLRWNNGWFGPGPVCFLATLSENLGQMDFEYGQFMGIGMSTPLRQNCGTGIDAIKNKYNIRAEESYEYPNMYAHAYFSSFGTWICNIVHNAINFEGVLKENKYYDTYVSFSNIAEIDSNGKGSQCVFDGDIYILPCEFTSCFKTYNNNAASSTLNSQQFVYYIPMETKINVCFDYGKNYRNTVNPNLQLEEGDMEGVASQDRPLHQYNYIYSDNNNSIREYMASMDEDEITHVEHRIVYSEPKTNGEDIDSWNTFKAANFIDADSHYGKITYLFTVKDIIHFWQTRAFGRLTVNERSLVTDENQNQITLGTGGVVQRTDYISTNYGMKQYDMSAVNAESDVYWIDRTNNILAVYSQGRVGSIGELHNVQNLINHLIDQDNLPTIHYDINAKEVIAKFLHQIDNNVETIEQLIYNTRVNIATAVYTRDYDDILEFNNVLYGINITEEAATQYNFLSINDVKDYLHPARLSFLVNVAPDTTKVFDNQKIVTTRRKSYKNSDKQEYTKNYMLNKKYTFTTDIHDTEWDQFNRASEAITDREGNILYTIPRYGDNVKWGSRLNGKWMKVDLDMMLDYQVTAQNDQTETKYQLEDDKPISQIITKFRRSYV